MADPAAAVAGTRRHDAGCASLLWAILILFALFYLVPLFVMLVTSLKTWRRSAAGNLLALPHGADASSLGQGLVRGLRRRRVHRASAGSSSTRSRWSIPAVADLDHARRAQRLRADQWRFKGANLDLRR